MIDARNPQCPNVNMTNNTVMTDTSNYISLLEEDDLYDLDAQDYHRCFLSMRGLRDEVLSELELADLRILGADVEDHLSITVFKIAHILGKHFRAGEWGQHRCGSVVTCVMAGRSVYARVNRFLQVDDDDCPGYASVTWFGAPEYPAHPNPVLVKCREDDVENRLLDAYGSVIRITQIDPTQVM